MIIASLAAVALLLSAADTPAAAAAPTPSPAPWADRDFTCFQSGSPYGAAIDIASDMAVVYGTHGDFAGRVAEWRRQGYAVGMMTGISWGGYDDYYTTPEGFRKDEVQTTRTGQLLMHGDSKTVGYNVPTDSYIEYIKKVVDPAIDAGVRAIFMEEPEFWARSGWSKAFQEEWQRFYGEPWQAPDATVDAQYRASKLKYEMYFKALREVFKHVKARAAEKGGAIECHVPTHSLINYAHWGIVSPESHLMDLAEMDGYIAQVWTGTSRTPNYFKGVRKERTFETAFLEYGQMLGMVRPTGRKVWFLADPIEDNPNYSWNNYKLNYECTVIASLMWPEVSRFEVMPWPDRIFQGAYPKVDMDSKSGDKEGIPADYATQLLAVINALNHMEQTDVSFDAGTQGVGILVSDTMMFQRANPHGSDKDLSSFYGLAMPFVKAGIPLEVVQLENVTQPGALSRCKVLMLTYEGQKPLKPEYHEALDAWVRDGGCLLFVEDGSDLYHNVREWWNDQGKKQAKAYDDLFARLGVKNAAYNEPMAVGKGWVRVLKEAPRQLARYDVGAKRMLELAGELLQKRGESLKTQQYFKLRRGPYVIASVMDESVTEAPLVIQGRFVDLFDPKLPVVAERTLQPNERTLLYDLDWARQHGVTAGVAAAATRIEQEQASEKKLEFRSRGPANTRARVRVILPAPPVSVQTEPAIAMDQQWDAGSGTLWLDFDNTAQDMKCAINW